MKLMVRVLILDTNITIHNTDVTEWLQNYNGPKFHSVISDVPYGLTFMGKDWDKFKTNLEYQKWVTEWGSLLIQHLYPGAVCMFFGGTRTYHRLATGLEDAGFEIFDSMMWCYGSGFPKSYNISKGIDKSLGLEREVLGEHPNPNHTGWITQGKVVNGDKTYLTKPNHTLAHQWNGYGTALKPAYEPIVLCRVPRGNESYVDCALNYGTGSLNISNCRIGNENRYNPYCTSEKFFGGFEMSKGGGLEVNGRFPANFGLICDCEKDDCECIEKELDSQSGISKSSGGNSVVVKNDIYGKFNESKNNNNPGLGDIGGASRFFYTAKSSRKERNLGTDKNNHPTVKPIKLIEYLSKLMLPPTENSSILIPFSGSGSEIIGSMLAGWNIINALEISQDYIQIAEDRVKYWKQYETYEQGLKGK